MSTGGEEELIRAVLDLHDSSGEVKELDDAVKQLIEDFNKQNDVVESGQDPLAKAIESLKSESTVVDDLRDHIGKLKRDLEALAESHKSGLIEQSKYKEKSDELVGSIQLQETILKRLTASESEAQAAFKALTESITAQTAAEEKAAIAADKLAMEANRNLIREQQRLDAVVLKNQENLEALAGQGDGESGQGGFKGAAAGAMKAEKAIHSLASGSGLGRLGSLLEGVVGPLGLPGVGLAIGALVYELEPAIPKIRDFVNAWETGIKPLSDTAEAIERLTRAEGDARQKRAHAAIEAKVTALEDKQDIQGFLSPRETLDLRRLREAANAKKDEADQEEAAKEQDKRQQAAKKENLAIQDEFDKAYRDRQKEAEKSETQWEFQGAKAAQRKQKDIEDAVKFAQEWTTKLDNKAVADDRKAEHDKAAGDRKSESDRQRMIRENMPEAIEHRARAAELNEEMGIARQVQSIRADQGDMMASQMGPQELQQVVAEVGRNRMMNSSLGFTLAQQVDYYMSQLEAKMVADFTRGMGAQNRTGQNVMPFGGF